jgi:hypothetical protein
MTSRSGVFGALAAVVAAPYAHVSLGSSGASGVVTHEEVSLHVGAGVLGASVTGAGVSVTGAEVSVGGFDEVSVGVFELVSVVVVLEELDEDDDEDALAAVESPLPASAMAAPAPASESVAATIVAIRNVERRTRIGRPLVEGVLSRLYHRSAGS